MTDTAGPEVQQLPVNGKVTGWQTGSPDSRGGDGWAVLYIDMGPIQATVKMSSREARAFAIETLCDQGPYLGYQPPNESMREHRGQGQFETCMNVRRPRWRERQSFEMAEERLRQLLDQFGEDAFGYALQRIREQP